jgi:hypothetical protein
MMSGGISPLILLNEATGKFSLCSKHDVRGTRRRSLRNRVTQSLCLDDETLQRNIIKCRKILNRSQGRAFLAAFYHSDGSLAITGSCRDFNLFESPTLTQRSEDLAKCRLKRGGGGFSTIGHESIFKIDATA